MTRGVRKSRILHVPLRFKIAILAVAAMIAVASAYPGISSIEGFLCAVVHARACGDHTIVVSIHGALLRIPKHAIDGITEDGPRRGERTITSARPVMRVRLDLLYPDLQSRRVAPREIQEEAAADFERWPRKYYPLHLQIGLGSRRLAESLDIHHRIRGGADRITETETQGAESFIKFLDLSPTGIFKRDLLLPQEIASVAGDVESGAYFECLRPMTTPKGRWTEDALCKAHSLFPVPLSGRQLSISYNLPRHHLFDWRAIDRRVREYVQALEIASSPK